LTNTNTNTNTNANANKKSTTIFKPSKKKKPINTNPKKKKNNKKKNRYPHEEQPALPPVPIELRDSSNCARGEPSFEFVPKHPEIFAM